MTMNAGRELDALVAEKVMGWHRRGLCWYDNDRDTNYHEDHPIFESDSLCWNPSTHIAAAWKVVEKLHELGFVVEVTMDNGTGRYCKVWKMADNSIYSPHETDSETIPLAICLVALKAVGVTPEPYNESDTLP